MSRLRRIAEGVLLIVFCYMVGWGVFLLFPHSAPWSHLLAGSLGILVGYLDSRYLHRKRKP